MTDIWFIRHGESESNAGLPSSSDRSTPLTPKGIEQAKNVALNLNTKPDLFVISPYLRTHQTAAPSLLRYPDTPIEIWPVHEFSYLGYEQYRDTTSKDRRGLSRSFFEKADPDKILGEGGESFNQFIQRVNRTITFLGTAEQEKIVIFGHGWFMRAMLWQLYNQNATRQGKKNMIRLINSILPSSRFALRLFHWLASKKWVKEMYAFLIFSAGIQTPNCSIFKFLVDDEKPLTLTGYDISHLPEDLRGTTLTNR